MLEERETRENLLLERYDVPQRQNVHPFGRGGGTTWGISSTAVSFTRTEKMPHVAAGNCRVRARAHAAAADALGQISGRGLVGLIDGQLAEGLDGAAIGLDL